MMWMRTQIEPFVAPPKKEDYEWLSISYRPELQRQIDETDRLLNITPSIRPKSTIEII